MAALLAEVCSAIAPPGSVPAALSGLGCAAERKEATWRRQGG